MEIVIKKQINEDSNLKIVFNFNTEPFYSLKGDNSDIISA